MCDKIKLDCLKMERLSSWRRVKSHTHTHTKEYTYSAAGVCSLNAGQQSAMNHACSSCKKKKKKRTSKRGQKKQANNWQHEGLQMYEKMKVQKAEAVIRAQRKHTSSWSVSFLQCTCRLGQLLQVAPSLGLTELSWPIRGPWQPGDGGHRSPRGLWLARHLSYRGTHTDVSSTFLWNPEQKCKQLLTSCIKFILLAWPWVIWIAQTRFSF